MSNDFTLADLFGPNPTRPTHPDFWKLSNAVLDLDGAMLEGLQQGRGVDDVIAEKAAQVGDSYAICYVAVQRSMHAHSVKTAGDLKGKFDEVARTAIIYMEGMIVGARLVEQKNEQGGDHD